MLCHGLHPVQELSHITCVMSSIMIVNDLVYIIQEKMHKIVFFFNLNSKMHKKLMSLSLGLCLLLNRHNSSQLLVLELCGEHVVHQVVKVGAVNQTLPLVARVHGHPAEVGRISPLTLHECPQGFALDGDRLFTRENEQLADSVQRHSTAEELTYLCVCVLFDHV